MSKRRFDGPWRTACGALLFACMVTANTAHAGDPIVAARDAFRAGDRAKLAHSVAAARGHVLEPYVQYWNVTLRMGQTPRSEVADFLHNHESTLLADKLRTQWLKHLGRNALWQEFDRDYPLLANSDQELECYALQSRLHRNEAGALDAARELWLKVDLPEACAAPLAALHAAGRVRADDVRERGGRLLEEGRIAAARASIELLPAAEQTDSRTLTQLVEAPGAFLDRQDARFPTQHMQQELAVAALARLARSDPRSAAERLEPLKARLSGTQCAHVHAQLGWQAALRHQPESLAWYAAAGDTPLSDEQLAWKVRAALRALDWQQVRATIEAMPPQLSTQPDWIYWRARALGALGHGDDARLLHRSIAGQANFYGNLADEELGRTIDVPPRAVAPTAEEIAEVAAQPEIRRVLALRRLDLHTEAVREWNWALRDRSDRFLLAAAEYARHNQMFDRAISAAERTRAEHDFALRYLAPFRDEVEPKTRALDLDQAWVYGLIRQESRFVTDARSWVGASGLMQLMPATAHWLARKLGMKRLSATSIKDRNTNILLGTNYLKLVLTSLDDHPVLASAAYNAGPGRAKRWRGARPLEGAIYAETIPIGETRDYVKKVMSNAVYYAALFEGKPQSLKARLGLLGSPGYAAPARDPIVSARTE
jgi:soluble lytic murein transglycosylase